VLLIDGEEQISMSLFQRAHDIVQAKANKALDTAEKPDEMLDLSYEQMLDQITRVRQGLVSVAASQKLSQTLDALQKRVNNFRTQKEVLKAQYTAAQAQTSVNETVSGISTTFGDTGADIARAQDKIAQMQARAGAVDELLASGVLEDVGGDTDDIQAELDETSTAAGVDKELAALKAEIGAGGSKPELTSGTESTSSAGS